MNRRKLFLGLVNVLLIVSFLKIALSQINILYDKTYKTPYGDIRYFIANNTSVPIPGEFAVLTTDNVTGVWFTLNCSANPAVCIDDYRLVLEMNGKPLNYTQPYYTGANIICPTPIYFAANNTSYNPTIWVAAAQKEYPNDTYAQCPSQKLDFVIVSGTDCGKYFPMFYFLDLGQTQISIMPLLNSTAYPGSNFPFLLCFYPVKDQALFIPQDFVTLTTFYPVADISVIVKNFDPTSVNVTLSVTPSSNALTPYLIYTDPSGSTTSGETINVTLPPALNRPGEVTLTLRIVAVNATNLTNVTVSLYRGTEFIANYTVGVKVYNTEGKATGAGGEIALIPLLISGLAFAMRRNE